MSVDGWPEFEVDRDGLEAYFAWGSLLLFVPFVFVFGIGLILAPIWWLTLAWPLARWRAQAIRYWIDEAGLLRVDDGALFRSRASVPLDRVTDVVLRQGPLMHRFGIWSLWIQTGGIPAQLGGRTWILYGLRSPEKVRDLILEERRKALQTMGMDRYV
jgi:putative membrane protein